MYKQLVMMGFETKSISTEDMLLNKKKQISYLLNVINMRSDLKSVISGEAGWFKVEVFADHLNDPGLKR